MEVGRAVGLTAGALCPACLPLHDGSIDLADAGPSAEVDGGAPEGAAEPDGSPRDGELAPAPPPTAPLFAAGFEDGTIGEWIADGLGGVSGGGHVTGERAHGGARSWRAYNDPGLPGAEAVSTRLLRGPLPLAAATYSAWFFWPADYVVSESEGQYVNLVQWKQADEPQAPVWIVAAMYSPAPMVPGGDELAIHAALAGEVHWTGAALPKDRWFEIAAHRRAGTADGELTVWLDGLEIFHAGAVDTVGGSLSPELVTFGVGNHCGAVDRAIYIDDVEIWPGP